MSYNEKKTQSLKTIRKTKSLNYKKNDFVVSSGSFGKKDNSFIFFGCWNNINCDEAYVFRDIILKILKQKEENSTIIIGGDNWYNQKYNKKTKYYPIKVLYTGYKLLFDISKDIYIVLGNHDIDTSDTSNTVSSVTPMEDYDNTISNRCMLKTQEYVINYILSQNYTNKSEKQIYSELTDYNIANSNVKNSKLHIFYPKIVNIGRYVYRLYINTNIYDESSDIIIEYTKAMETLLLKTKDIKLLFVVGHHPFVGLKVKKDKYQQGINDFYIKGDTDLKKSLEIFKIIELLNKYKTIYLCADVHSFQICKIHKKVGMVIVGTGGASKDLIDDKVKKIDFIIDIFDENNKKVNKINVTDIHAYNAYGYSKISYDNNYDVYIEYLQIDETKMNETETNGHIPYKTYNFKYEFNITNDCWDIVNKNGGIIKIPLIKPTYYCKGKFPIFIDGENDVQFENLIKDVQLVKLNSDEYCYNPVVKKKSKD